LLQSGLSEELCLLFGSALEKPMRRREFITLVAGAGAAWPLAVRAQQSRKPPTIGYLGATSPSVERPRVAAFVKRLGELGWIMDRSVMIELRWAEGRAERAHQIAAEFVQLKVDVIVTAGSVDVLAAKQATTSIPIVFAAAGDPVGSGLVESLARPGGNVTGLSLQITDTAGKRLSLLREIVPGLHRLAILGNVTARSVMVEISEVQVAARTLGLETITSEIRRAEDIDPAIEAVKGRADALYICSDPLVTSNQARINNLALNTRLPTMHGLPESAAAGGLAAYGVDIPALCGRAAEIVDKILRGTKPADIPVEQPTTFKLVINLKTANALGITVPYSMQLLADDVID
jgi:putative tryptophan/tyrosine transport system substrate-binding protein